MSTPKNKKNWKNSFTDAREAMLDLLTFPIGAEGQNGVRRAAIAPGVLVILLATFFGINLSQDLFEGSILGSIAITIMLVMLVRMIFIALKWILKNQPLQRLENHFIWAAGASKTTLDDCPRSEQLKYAALGMAMYIPALLGVVTATYIGCDIFELEYPLLLGLFWGLIIFMIDRALVVGMQRNQKERYDWSSMVLRILLATMIGLVVATPIELMVFDREIQEQLAFEKEESFKQFDAEQEDEIREVRERIDQAEAEVDAAYAIYLDEVNNSIGGRRPGHGPEAKIKRADWEEKKQRFEQETLPKLEAEIDEIEAKYESKKANWVETQAEGLGGRLEALHRTQERKPMIFYAHIALWLFFLFIELVPVLAKMLMRAGPYDHRIAELKRSEQERSRQAILDAQTATEEAAVAAQNRIDQAKQQATHQLTLQGQQHDTELQLQEEDATSRLNMCRAVNSEKQNHIAPLARQQAEEQLLTARLDEVTRLGAKLNDPNTVDALKPTLQAIQAKRIEELNNIYVN